MSSMRFLWLAAGVLSMSAAMFGSSGCTTQAFCFDNCNGDTTTGTSTSNPTGTGGTGGTLFPSGTGGEGGCFLNCPTTSSSTGMCMQTNGGVEICDGVDNDCNGSVDDVPGLDLTNPKTCGTCTNNCYAIPGSNWDALTVTCTPTSPGQPGTCAGTCTQDYYDLTSPKDGLCEYYCVKSAPNVTTDSTCDNKDDDCDGSIDEDVNLCTDVNNCGACQKQCFVAHGTAACVPSGGPPCDTANTKCEIAVVGGQKQCDCNGVGDCWWDVDNSYATGCEYQCDVTNGGVEICDGKDNDCDGQIDENIPSTPCQGGQLGICALPANAGMSQCVNGQIVCAGPNVVKPGDKPELCNTLDDDCDGQVDDNPMGANVACGTSNIFPCTFGTTQCQGGQLVCIGNKDPQPEVCNGQDDDCDGTIDDSPSDAVGACNVPIPPPAGATSPCKAGTKACTGGVVTCVGSVTATPGAVDACGVDTNCDGQLTNQPAKNDVFNCGACGNNCLAGAVHANWTCVQNGPGPNDYGCQFQGCQPGYYDNGGPGDTVAGDQKCGYACAFVSAQEACNGQDDNCNGQVDENVNANPPSPVQVCGVSPQANTAECLPGPVGTGVQVACQNGGWKCTFPAGVCNPTCATASEICDTRDNDCDGLVNENVANFGKPCASDDAAPVPGHGACRTTGTFVCNGPNAVACSAVKADCATLPGGCTELCDGVDNDCDGSIDETFQAKGTNVTNFVKPAVTKIGAALWVYAYEASRPNATTAVPGTGNGYQCTNCPAGVPAAPAGVTLDKTKSCSVPSKIPWFNVTPIEAEQTCNAMGGRLCTLADWQGACDTNPPSATNCTWGYAPNGAACTTPATATKKCNLGPTYDFLPGTPGDQDGLLVTGSAALGNPNNCYADWTTFLGNNVNNGKIFDITGNLREIVEDTNTNPSVYRAMGGSFSSAVEDGATCQFQFYSVASNFQLYDLGFRCCFLQDPTL